jgi:hypothetical protein
MYFNQSGSVGDVYWSIKHVGERDFLITVRKGDREEQKLYKCMYPIIFGMDIYDHGEINRILDELIEKLDPSAGANETIKI